jgi:hypothetical protein
MPTPKRPPKYRVDTATPKNTGTKEHPQFGPSGTRKGSGEKVYTEADEKAYKKATTSKKTKSDYERN